MPSISVIIPTLNAEEEIGPLLDSLLGLNTCPDEILVVDSSSDDMTQDIVKQYSKKGVRLKVICRKEFDHGGTRHQAFLETRGDFVFFLTQDAVPADESYVENMLAPFDDPQVAMASGRQLPKPGARRYVQLVQEFNYPPEPNVRSVDDIPRLGIKAFFASDACSAYRRFAYLEAGGFEHPLNTNEDMLMAATFLHAGWKVAYAADACVLHSHNLSPREQYHRNREVGIFLARHAAELGVSDEVGEGGRLVRSVVSRLMIERHLIELVAFSIDCIARLLGNRAGRRSQEP